MSDTTSPARLVVLISGNGTNLQALLDACQDVSLAAQVVAVVSNRRDAYGLVRAQQAGVPTAYHPLKPYTDSGRTREDYDEDLAAIVSGFQPDLIVCAGWMQVLTPVFISRFADRLINLHPALPGLFPGTHAIERAFTAFQQGEIESSGAMVHFVVPAVDAGPVLDQIVVPILPHDQLDDFEERMHVHERILLVRAVQKWLTERASLPAV
ncbi:phosphoribosylglycinamide formyltransferase [Candidatus Amarolinea aalborgensis]|uniref:phosphoribosylglycinamide formyltransferase n=1 Tax=Candidatus Amarolinea aalborgensis TaxID=2249329 RepID=UPI003BF95995